MALTVCATADFYAQRNYLPAWNDADNVKQLLASLNATALDGLNPAYYQVAELAKTEALLLASTPTPVILRPCMPTSRRCCNSGATRSTPGCSKRATSSGYIRVEHPLELVQLLFNDPMKWSAAAIAAKLQTTTTENVTLPIRVPLLLAYLTVDLTDDGLVTFKSDVHGHDAACRRHSTRPCRPWQWQFAATSSFERSATSCGGIPAMIPDGSAQRARSSPRARRCPSGNEYRAPSNFPAHKSASA